MLDDMRLAGFAQRTRDVYIQAVRRLAAHYKRSPDQLSEEEVRKVEVGDIESARGLLRVFGKGDKERRVPLPDAMLADLRRLWPTHRSTRWVTPDRSGTGPVSKHALWRTFCLAVRAAGIKRPVSPHSLRRSYATRLLEQGIEARVVQILLGHVNIATTAVYLHLTEPTRASLKATLDKLMTDL
jgi:site-specific recombinase XerD